MSFYFPCVKLRLLFELDNNQNPWVFLDRKTIFRRNFPQQKFFCFWKPNIQTKRKFEQTVLAASTVTGKLIEPTACEKYNSLRDSISARCYSFHWKSLWLRTIFHPSKPPIGIENCTKRENPNSFVVRKCGGVLSSKWFY